MRKLRDGTGKNGERTRGGREEKAQNEGTHLARSQETSTDMTEKLRQASKVQRRGELSSRGKEVGEGEGRQRNNEECKKKKFAKTR